MKHFRFTTKMNGAYPSPYTMDVEAETWADASLQVLRKVATEDNLDNIVMTCRVGRLMKARIDDPEATSYQGLTHTAELVEVDNG